MKQIAFQIFPVGISPIPTCFMIKFCLIILMPVDITAHSFLITIQCRINYVAVIGFNFIFKHPIMIKMQLSK